jgi:hypothetical protein
MDFLSLTVGTITDISGRSANFFRKLFRFRLAEFLTSIIKLSQFNSQ